MDAGPIPRNMTINAQCDLVADGFSITLQRNGDLTQGTMVIGTICDLQGDTATIDTAWGTRQICRSFTNLVWNPNNGTGDPDAGAALAQACSE